MATTTAETEPAPRSERLRRLSLTQRILARPAAGALIIVVFVWLVFAAISVAKGNLAFIALSGTLNYLDVAAQVGIIGTAVALLMIAGEFDLSVGSMVGFAGILIGIGVTIWGLPLWLSILMSMVATTFLGVLNGIIVVRTGLPSFIVTLATLFIISGFSSVLTSIVTNITYIPISREVVAADPIAGFFNWSLPVGGGASFKVSILWWLLLTVIGVYILGRTRFGNWIAGVGGSATAARNLGVPVARVKISLFALTAFSASILATIQSMTFFSADILRGRGIELDDIILTVIGVYILGRTRFGNWIAGVGGSATAARNLGVPVARVKISLFALTAFSASILATIQSMTFFSADILRGRGIELDAITTAVIGGSLLTGGYGSVAGTALGALSLGMARQGIVFADINADWYKIAIGTLLLVAVVLNNWIRRKFAGL